MNAYNLLSDEQLEKATNTGPGFIKTAIRSTRVEGLLRVIIDDATEEERLANRNKLTHLLNTKE